MKGKVIGGNKMEAKKSEKKPWSQEPLERVQGRKGIRRPGVIENVLAKTFFSC